MAFAAAMLSMLAFAPPLYGRTLLIPLNGRPIADAVLARAMVSRLRPGPLPGSAVVEGEGRPVAGQLLRQGIVMLSAPAGLCSRRSD